MDAKMTSGLPRRVAAVAAPAKRQKAAKKSKLALDIVLVNVLQAFVSSEGPVRMCLGGGRRVR